MWPVYLLLSLLQVSSLCTAENLLSQRETSDDSCTVVATGGLSLVPFSSPYWDGGEFGPTKIVGFIEKAKAIGTDGENDSLLVTEYANGQDLTVPHPTFEFVKCKGVKQDQVVPDGIKFPKGHNGNHKFTWGFVRPVGAEKHQLGIANGRFGGSGEHGQRTPIVSERVDKTPEKHRLWIATPASPSPQDPNAKPIWFLFLAQYPTMGLVGQQTYKPLLYYLPSKGNVILKHFTLALH